MMIGDNKLEQNELHGMDGDDYDDTTPLELRNNLLHYWHVQIQMYQTVCVEHGLCCICYSVTILWDFDKGLGTDCNSTALSLFHL